MGWRLVLVSVAVVAGCRDRSTVKKDPTPEPSPVTPDAHVEHVRHVWSKLYTSSEDRLPRDLALDAAGNAIVVGRFTGKVDFGSGAIESSGSSDAFVVSISPKGVTRWARALGGFGFDEAFAVATAPDGTVLVGGDITGEVDFGTGKIGTGVANAPFIAALDPTGKTLWARALSGEGEITGIARSPDGDLQIVGRDLIKGPWSGTADVSAARLTAKGDPKWKVVSDSGGYGRAQRVVVDAAGDAFVCGTFRSHLAIGGLAMVPGSGKSAPPTSADQLFVAKLSGKDGGVAWGTAGFGDGASCQAIASSRDVLAIGGYYAGEVAFGATKLPKLGPHGGFVASFTGEGTLRFASAMGDINANDSVGGLAFGAGGELLVAGEATSTVASIASDQAGAYVAVVDVDGKVRWARRFVGGTPMGLSRAPDGVLTLAGEVFTTDDSPGSIDLGGGVLKSAPAVKGSSHFDVFVAQLSQ
jgi:hypothetical protein